MAAKEEEEMNIIVKTLNGQIRILRAEPHNTLAEVKYSVQGMFGHRAENIRLFYAGVTLEDDRMLADYNIHNNFTIHCVFRTSQYDDSLIRYQADEEPVVGGKSDAVSADNSPEQQVLT